MLPETAASFANRYAVSFPRLSAKTTREDGEDFSFDPGPFRSSNRVLEPKYDGEM